MSGMTSSNKIKRGCQGGSSQHDDRPDGPVAGDELLQERAAGGLGAEYEAAYLKRPGTTRRTT